jgi:hypothetical protein
MAKQEIYGTPVHAPKDSIVLRQHWNYGINGDVTRKARNCCNGSPRAAPQLVLANTYSSCVKQPCMRLFFALCTHEGFVSLKVNATNAYANSPPPPTNRRSSSSMINTLTGISVHSGSPSHGMSSSLFNTPSKAILNPAPSGKYS